MDRSDTVRGGFARRFVPSTLGGRLIGTVVLLALTTAVLTIAISLAFLLTQSALRGEMARVGGLASVETAAVESSLLSGVLAATIGVLLGVALTRVLRKPIEEMVEHLKTQGHLAVEGAPYTTDSPASAEELPREFRELGGVVDDLLRSLTERQADLKDAIAEARLAEESLGIVVSESRESKMMLHEGRVVVANPAACVALGLPEASVIDRPLSDSLDGVTVTDETGRVVGPEDLLARSLGGALTVQLTRGGQAPRWYVFRAARHAEDDDRVLITAHDITEERRLMELRSEIVSLISHDLRSPLAVVVGYLELLRKPLTDDERERAIEGAKRNAGRMADLLEDLLAAARAEELLAPTSLAPVRLIDLADEVVTSMAATHAERVITLEASCRPVVMGEERRLRQALVNLVTNAFKYSPDESPITVAIECSDGTTRLTVSDHGPGVPPDDRQRVFDRYTRLEETADGRPGVGLGLYIVRIIAENHGGSAHVDETPGGGATFVIDLPCAGREDEDGVAECAGAASA